jgi:hypothetical protein
MLSPIVVWTMGGSIKEFLHTNSLGDDFVSSYWWRRTLGGQIGTAVIIASLVWFITSQLSGLLESRDRQIQQIQIIPYD